MAGVSRPAISKALRGPLRAALLPDGRIDSGHPAALDYLGAVPRPDGGLRSDARARMASFEAVDSDGAPTRIAPSRPLRSFGAGP